LKDGITRFYSLDILRGLAAISVVLYHWRHFFGSNLGGAKANIMKMPFADFILLIYKHGNLAVDLFFCLSGFVFYWLYSKSIASGSMKPGEFFMLRLSRLYPLHIVTLMMVATGQAIFFYTNGYFFRHYHNDVTHFFLNLILASSWGLESGLSFNSSSWSISVEALLYLFFFLICRILPVRFGVLFAISIVGFFIEHRYEPLGRGFASFFIGGCIFLLYREIIGCSYTDAISKWLFRAMISAWMTTWIVSMTSLGTFHRLFGHDYLAVNHVVVGWAVAVLFPLTVLSLALTELCCVKMGRSLAVIGDISYSVYLWHFPLQMAFYAVVTHYTRDDDVYYSPWFMVAFFAVLLPLAWASYHYFESPMQRYLRRTVNLRKIQESRGVIGAYSKGS
jgi:peptidoglycan/LPS O-acetylase OafA/YrhL